MTQPNKIVTTNQDPGIGMKTLVNVCVNPGKNGRIVAQATVLMLSILVNVS